MENIIVVNYAFHYTKLKNEEPLKEIIKDWVKEDADEVQRNMQLSGGDKYKYKVHFNFPMIFKITTIAKQRGGRFIPV